MSWTTRAAANLLPLSREQEKLAVALSEWRYTGDYNDLGAPVETCKLCDDRLLRYAEFSQRRWPNQLLDLHGRTL